MFFVYWITDKINICISGQEAFELGYRNGGGGGGTWEELLYDWNDMDKISNFLFFFYSLCICNKFYKASLEFIETLNYICLKIRFDYTDSQN